MNPTPPVAPWIEYLLRAVMRIPQWENLISGLVVTLVMSFLVLGLVWHRRRALRAK